MDTFENITGSANVSAGYCGGVSDSPGVKAAKVTSYALLMVLSMLGNGLVLAIIYRNPHMRTTTNYFIANMACSDLIIPIFVGPSNIIDIISGSSRMWLVTGPVGLALCKTMSFLLDVSTAVSIQSLVAMAVDRYYAVAYPLKASFTKRARACVIPLIWVISAAVHAPHFYTFKLYEINNNTHCYSSWEPGLDNKPTMKRYQMTLFVSLYGLPVVLISVLYGQTLRRLKNRVIPGDILPERKRREDATTRNILKMAVTVVAAFALAWLPVHVLILCLFYKWNWTLPCHLSAVWFMAFYLGYANSVLNPCIYFHFNKNYRTGLKEIWEALCCTRQRRTRLERAVAADRSMGVIRGTELSTMESKYVTVRNDTKFASSTQDA